MAMLVPAKPSLCLSTLIDSTELSLCPPWRECSFFSSGRDALAAALKTFQLPPGVSIVLPAFICRSVPDRLTKLGFTPYFVDSATDAPHPPLEALNQACYHDEVKGLLLVDFFGFLPKGRLEIAQNARSNGCVVIEDRCHSALTKPLREVADAVIYSLRKSLPCADGGALWLEKCHVVTPTVVSMLPFLRSVPFLLMRELERVVCNLGWPNIYSDLLSDACRAKSNVDVALERGSVPPEVMSVSPSWLLMRQLNHASFLSWAANRRRINYNILREMLDGVAPLFVLPSGETVPQNLPILDPSGELVVYLRERGVGAYRWPGDDLPDQVVCDGSRFPNSLRWNREVVCLPIHQAIEERHIERMALLIEQFSSAGG